MIPAHASIGREGVLTSTCIVSRESSAASSDGRLVKPYQMLKPLIVLLAAAAVLVLAPAGRVGAIEKGTQEKAQKEDLKPGEYVWEPEKSPKGSVDIIVSLGKQRLFVYRDGVLIGRSTISSGSKGRETPTGIYMILEKNLTHHSNKYHEASMPFMERLTWGGLAIHAGNTPGHPESHGCMHVPEDFARKLYGITEEGDTVLVANDESRPDTTTDPNQLFSEPADASGAPMATPAPTASPGGSPAPDASPAPGKAPDFVWKPEEVPSGPVAIVFTSTDKHVYVYRKGVEIGRADLGGPDAGHPFGNHVYVALAAPAAGGPLPWELLGSGDGSPAPDLPDLAKSLVTPPGFRQKMQTLIKPGTTLVLTDHAANPTRPSNPD